MKRFRSEHNSHMAMVVDILRTAEVLDKKVAAVLKERNITHGQFNVLRILQGAQPKPLTSTKIRERLVFTGTDLSRMIDRLVRNGLVDRSANKDNRRKVDLTLSSKGMDVLKYVLPKIEKALDGFYKNRVSEEELAVTRRVMQEIRNS